MRRLIAGIVLVVLAAGCRSGGPTAPPITVVTATPAGGAIPTVGAPGGGAAVTATPSVAAGTTPGAGGSTADMVATTVGFVLAKQDINIRGGPGTDFPIVGGVYAGMTAKVTGYKSANGQWWRVVCPVGPGENCWVSADPALTEPATGPGVTPSPTP